MIESISERMKVIADMLGVEFGEEFDVGSYSFNPCRITERGLFDCENDNESGLIAELLTGDRSIIKRPKAPWKPKVGEWYWYVVPNATVCDTTFCPGVSTMDANNYRTGNCFPNKETALANVDIMLEKFNTPELTPASWTPERGETYWALLAEGEAISLEWEEDIFDYKSKVTGSIYRTEAEAIADYPNLRKRLGMPEVDA